MPFFPWTRFKQLLKQPWMYYTAGFGLQYLCNDISAAVQKQGYGVITFVPYMAVFSILAVDFVFAWVKHVRRQETLPRHTQDIHMNATCQAEDMQMDQTHRSSLSRQKTFNRRPWMVNEEVKAASGNMQQTGETGESQCLTSDSKDEVAEVKKPQQSVSTTENTCTEARVWKSPDLPKQDLTSSLANGSIGSQGGSTYSGTGVAARGNSRCAHTESTSKNDDVKDEVMESKIPLQNRFSSKNKQSIGSRGCSINNVTGVATTGNQRTAHTESTSQNDDSKDVVMEAKNPQQHSFHSKNKQSIVSRGSYTNSGRGVETTGDWRSANAGSTSKKDDPKGRIEWKNLQQPRSPSKNKCVPPAHELLDLQDPTFTSRFGMGTGSGRSGKGLATGNT